MKIQMKLNGKNIQEEIRPDMLLLDLVRSHGCASVKRGCETSNCGLCTVILNGKPVLSCSVLAARANGAAVEDPGGTSGGSGGAGSFYRGPGSGAVRFLQSGIYSQRHRPVPGEPGSLGSGDPGISGGKSLPLFRL